MSEFGARVRDITPNSATILWSTRYPLTSQVEYGVTSDYGSLSAFSRTPATTHAVTLTGLAPGTTYHYAALSTDVRGRISRSTDLTFSSASASGAPVISRLIASETALTSATITWTTDKPSASQVEYGMTRAHGFLSAFSSAMVTDHRVTLNGLNPGTNYDAIALSVGAAGKVGRSGSLAFATTGAAGAPTIGAVRVERIATNSATLSWATDQPSASQVAYGPTTAYGLLSGYNTAPATRHEVTLIGLSPGKTYNCMAFSANSRGLVGKSANIILTTTGAQGPPVLSSTKVGDVTADSANVTWTTDQPSTSQVRYGANRTYSFLSAFSSTPVISHSVVLTGLKSGKTYDAVALSTNQTASVGKSGNLTFTIGRRAPSNH